MPIMHTMPFRAEEWRHHVAPPALAEKKIGLLVFGITKNMMLAMLAFPLTYNQPTILIAR